MNDSSLADHVVELLADEGEVVARRMFGGFGIFESELMFALIADGILFFKTDTENEATFEERDLARFTYQRNDRAMHLNYREAPPEALETQAEMKKWSALGMAAARRADAAKELKKKKPAKRKQTP
jgi:DNA transformation protein